MPTPEEKATSRIAEERTRFEHWISSPPFEKDSSRYPMDESLSAWPGSYQELDVELAWQAWKAALGH